MRRRGMTIIELLVAIGIIALLIGIVIPVLGLVRQSARRSVAESYMRTHATQFAAYSADYSDTYPLYTDPARAYTTIELPEGEGELELRYFGGVRSWNIALYTYYDGRFFHESFASPLRRDAGERYPSAWYSQTFRAGRDYWLTEQRTGPEQWRAVRGTEVTFPAQKSVLVEWPWSGPDERFGENHDKGVVGFVDTSVLSISPYALTTGYPTGTGDWPGCYLNGPYPGMHTIGGVTGRDLESR